MTCRCGHARQVHEPADGSICRGHCSNHGHADTDHTGACTARCHCDIYIERTSTWTTPSR